MERILPSTDTAEADAPEEEFAADDTEVTERPGKLKGVFEGVPDLPFTRKARPRSAR